MKKTILISFALMMLAAGRSLAFTPDGTYGLFLGKKAAFVKDASLNDGVDVVMWTDTKVAAQRWRLEVLDDSTVCLWNLHSNRPLSAVGTRKAGTKVTQRSSTAASRTWTLQAAPGGTGRWRLVQQNSSGARFLLGAVASADGSTLQLYAEEGADPALVDWDLREEKDVPSAFDEQVRDDIMAGFIKQYYRSVSTGHVLGGGGWWGDAEMFETILDAYETTGDTKYKTYFDELCKNFVQRNGTDWSGNDYNDDITWMVLACIRAYKYFGTTSYRTYAKNNFDKMYKRAQVFPEGMLRWCQGKPSTNSCINGPAVVAACYLYEMTGDEAYLEKAIATYAGQRAHLMNSSDGHVYDSGEWKDSKFNVTNQWCSTYNQGTMLGSAVKLWQLTGETKYLQDATKIWKYSYNNLTESKNHIVHVCQVSTGDLCGFKGIFMRYARLFAECTGNADVMKWMAKNAWYAYQNRNSKGVIWSKWLTKTSENFRDGDSNFQNDPFGASTAVSVAFNAHLGGQLEKDAFSPIGVKLFDDIQFTLLGSDLTESDEPVTTLTTAEKAFVGFRGVTFGNTESDGVLIRAKAANERTRVAVYMDGLAEENLLAVSDTLPTGWNTTYIPIPPVSGTHTFRFVLLKTGRLAMSYVQFLARDTAVEPLTEGEPEGGCASSELFDMQGRAISQPEKGQIYIRGGRKRVDL